MTKTARQILNESRQIQLELIAAHPGWAQSLRTVRIRVSNRMTRVAGRCFYNRGEVAISVPFFADEQNDLRETVTHELAHMVAGREAGHGPWFKKVHRTMGGSGDQYHRMSLSAAHAHKRKPKVEAICFKCGRVMQLGPVQARRHVSGQRTYRHVDCH